MNFILLVSCKEALNLHLMQLLNAAEKKLEEKGISTLYPMKNDEDKHTALWKRRVRIVRRMKSALDLLSESSAIPLLH